MSQPADPDEGMSPWERVRRCAHRDIDRICTAWPRALNDAQARGWGTGRTYDGASRSGASILVDDERIPVTSVEAAALEPSFAVAWIAELADVLHECRRGGGYGLRLDHERAPGVPWTGSNACKAMHDALEALMIAPDRQAWRWAERTTARLRHLARLAFRWEPPPKQGETVGGVTVGARGNLVEDCTACGMPAPTGRDEHGRPLVRRRGSDGAIFHTSCYYDLAATPLKAGRRGTCKAEGCDLPVRTSGLCQSHYNRWRSTGIIGGPIGITSYALTTLDQTG